MSRSGPVLRRRAARAIALLASLSAAGALASAPASELPTGPPWSAVAEGCTCHGADPTSEVTAYVNGLPPHYVAGETYALEVGVDGGPPPADPGKNQGGFLIGATAGEFKVPAGSNLVETGAESISAGSPEVPLNLVTQARQTEPGAKFRSWTVDWTAPDPAVGDVFFVLAVNSVNGNAGTPTGNQGDEWNRNTFVARGAGGFKADPLVASYTEAAVLMGATGILLTALFTILGYVLIARGTR